MLDYVSNSKRLVYVCYVNYEKYDNVITSPDKLEFQFVSEGPRGSIIKVIQFTQTTNPEIYNLAFGNLKHDGSVDDETTI